MNMNRVNLLGNIYRIVAFRTNTGLVVVEGTIAATNTSGPKPRPIFIPFQALGNLALNIENNFKVGMVVRAGGILQYEVWEGATGVRHSRVRVKLLSVHQVTPTYGQRE